MLSPKQSSNGLRIDNMQVVYSVYSADEGVAATPRLSSSSVWRSCAAWCGLMQCLHVLQRIHYHFQPPLQVLAFHEPHAMEGFRAQHNYSRQEHDTCVLDQKKVANVKKVFQLVPSKQQLHLQQAVGELGSAQAFSGAV